MGPWVGRGTMLGWCIAAVEGLYSSFSLQHSLQQNDPAPPLRHQSTRSYDGIAGHVHLQYDPYTLCKSWKAIRSLTKPHVRHME